jgi:hypothetical protein
VFSLYFDEDSLQNALISALIRAGFDCLTSTDARMRGKGDERQLLFAASQKRVLFTSNVGDFRRLDAEWRQSGRSHAGIILLTRQRTPIGVQLRAFEEMGRRFGPEDLENRVEFLLNYR